MWALRKNAVTETCKGHHLFIYISETDFLTDYQLCDRLCDGDIYRYEVRNVPPSWGVHVES